jgi:hypothetical protein
MKKYIRNILLISLVINSSICFSQDWSGDSRIRVENYQTENEEDSQLNSANRSRLGIKWSGDKWSMNMIGNYYYKFQDAAKDLNNIGTASVYEASISTSLPFGMTLSAGRMALNYGDGRIIGNDNWGNNGRTHDGLVIRYEYEDLLKIDVGTDAIGLESLNEDHTKDWAYVYLSSKGDNFNLDGAYLIVNAKNTMGIALDYIMDSKLDLGFDYWNQTWYETAFEKNMDESASLMAISINYPLNEKTNVGGGMDMFSEKNGGTWDASWGDYHQFNGAMDVAEKFLQEEISPEEFEVIGAWNDIYFNLSYDLNNWGLVGLAYHMISADDEELGGNEIDISLTNTLNDHINYGFGYSMFTPNNDSDGSSWMYLQISATP